MNVGELRRERARATDDGAASGAEATGRRLLPLESGGEALLLVVAVLSLYELVGGR